MRYKNRANGTIVNSFGKQEHSERYMQNALVYILFQNLFYEEKNILATIHSDRHTFILVLSRVQPHECVLTSLTNHACRLSKPICL